MVADYLNPSPDPTGTKPIASRLYQILIGLTGGLVLIIVIFWWFNRPPADFAPTEVTVKPGTSAAEIVDILKEKNIVRSADLLYLTLLIFYDPSDIHAGVFVFKEPVTAIAAAELLATTAPQDELLRVTFPEGFSAYEFSNFLPAELTEVQIALNVPSVEGYLFPDTYYIPTTFEPADLIALMQETFEEKISSLEPQITTSTFSREEVVILASIIEREANDDESMGLVSGILQSRLQLGIPLQVDASVAYGLQKAGTELTRTDVETDGAYNTYTRAGLPPTPISNPGLNALKAVLNPIPSDYLYYITAPDGTFHYAETLDEHNSNVSRYLR